MRSRPFMLCIVGLSLLSSEAYCGNNSDVFRPKTRTIEIEAITQDVIDIRPGGAVKIIFPWVLSEKADELPYYARLATDNVFEIKTKEGQNALIIYYKNFSPSFEGEVVDLTISSRGYHFTFAVRANFDPEDYYSNVVLKLGDAEMLTLLEKEKQKYLKALAKERSKMIEEMDLRAHQKALQLVGGLSKKRPKEKRIKEESVLSLSNGDRIVAYVDVAKHYDKFSVFNFEVKNDSGHSPLYIQGVEISRVDKSGIKSPISSAYEFSPRLDRGETAEGTLSTLDEIPNTDVVLAILTDRGRVEVEW